MKMVMPKMGMTMEEGTIVEWKKKNGEYVEKGEIILEIMTNKVNIDVESPSSGYLKILRGPDEALPVGEVIALIEESVEAAERVSEVPVTQFEEVPVSRVEVEPPIAGVADIAERIPASPRARRLAEERGISLERITGTGLGGAITESDVLRELGEKVTTPVSGGLGIESGSSAQSGGVSPLAERIARERGVDLSKVKGTGIGGKITKEDVLRYIEREVEPEVVPEIPEVPVYEAPVEPAEPEVVPEIPEVPKVVPEELGAAGPEVVPERPEVPRAVTEPEVVPEAVPERPERPQVTEKPHIPPEAPGIPLTGIKKLTAERMIKSKREAPHLTLAMEVSMTEASKLKTSLTVSYTDIIVKATALALKKHPIMNSTLKENRIILREPINIGIAVARNEDLLVPVIHNADNRSLKEISRITKDIIERTQKDQLTEKDVLDGTFTISNLGMYGIDFFTPIINPPEAAILGVGKIKKVPVVINDQIHIREKVLLSLSFDHRIVNGMPAALFLQEIKNLLEHPYRLFMEGET